MTAELLRSRDIVIGPTLPRPVPVVPPAKRSDEPLIVALYGGPGTGKSTTASLLFSRLKMAGVNCELVHEVAKDFTWEDRSFALKHQPYLMAKQLRNYDRLYGKVDVIVTDTSPLLAYVYHPPAPVGRLQAQVAFLQWISADWKARNTLDVMLHRDPEKAYSQAGRSQTEDEAKRLDRRISNLLVTQGVDPMTVYVEKSTGGHVSEIEREVYKCLPR